MQIRELDWLVLPESWTWDNPLAVASQSPPEPTEAQNLLGPPFDLIVSADTVYSAELLGPMLRTLHALSTLSKSSASRFPPILLCIERRDPQLVDTLLQRARDEWHFAVERVPHKKMSRVVEKIAHWEKSEWADVELWKLRLTEGKKF